MDLAAPVGNSDNAAIIALAIVSAARIDKQGQLIVRFVNRFFHMDPPFSLSSANHLLTTESFPLLSFTAKRKAPHENKTCAITCYAFIRCQGSHKIVLRLRAMNSI